MGVIRFNYQLQRYEKYLGKEKVSGVFLLPQRLFLPAGWESHRRNIHFREQREQRLDFLLHVIAWGNRIEEVLQTAKMRVQLVGYRNLMVEPFLSKRLGGLRNDRKVSIVCRKPRCACQHSKKDSSEFRWHAFAGIRFLCPIKNNKGRKASWPNVL